jgi:hypothetical protein
MKYIVKAEIAVYEEDGELTDVFRSELKVIADTKEDGRKLGSKILDSAMLHMGISRERVQ